MENQFSLFRAFFYKRLTSVWFISFDDWLTKNHLLEHQPHQSLALWYSDGARTEACHTRRRRPKRKFRKSLYDRSIAASQLQIVTSMLTWSDRRNHYWAPGPRWLAKDMCSGACTNLAAARSLKRVKFREFSCARTLFLFNEYVSVWSHSLTGR